ncbi:alpha/beta fold hydrolase [Nakamurella aerolata]|uniref:alpha/beta fold hydrolase n=1 Tax=Nakamurella aerolata TaxID=1656892 RepID=UPI001BB1A456|nr:alpha/beta fold hydrolase [Nakamurella aerolata]
MSAPPPAAASGPDGPPAAQRPGGATRRSSRRSLGAGRRGTRRWIAAALALLVVAGAAVIFWPRTPAPAVSTQQLSITGARAPWDAGPVQLDATIYLPERTPAPAVIVAHGFGGSKDSVAPQARRLAEQGFVALAYSARGFGRSTGTISLDSLDAEIPDGRAVVDYLATRTDVQQDANNDPLVGVTGGSYGGALALMLAGTDQRVDTTVPVITWNNLQTALFPNAFTPTTASGAATPGSTNGSAGTDAADNGTATDTAAAGAPRTPAAMAAAPDGVFKKYWASALISSVVSGQSLDSSAAVDPGTGSGSGSSDSSGGDSSGGDSSGGGSSGGDPGEGGAASGNASTSSASSSASGAPGSNAGPANNATPPSNTDTTGVLGCGRLRPEVCAAYADAADTGRISTAMSDLLARSSPALVVGDITAPTLLVQGEQDTLFGLDQADANARAIAANGTEVAVDWYRGGHDAGAPDSATEDRITGWLRYYLGLAPADSAAPSAAFRYSVDGGLTDSGRPRTRVLQTPNYPGLTAGSVPRQDISLTGSDQVVLNPPGGSPAAITSLPGLGQLNQLSAFLANGLPGQSAQFRSGPLPQLQVVTGSARVRVTVTALPTPATGSASGETGTGDQTQGGNAPTGPVLFAAIGSQASNGRVTLGGNAVAPVRLAPLAPGASTTVDIDLPAVSLQVAEGDALVVRLATTDQAYSGPTAPAAYRISGVSAVSVPLVGGVQVSAGELPIGTLIALVVLALLAGIALWWIGRTSRRPAFAGTPNPGAGTPNARAGTPNSVGVDKPSDVAPARGQTPPPDDPATPTPPAPAPARAATLPSSANPDPAPTRGASPDRPAPVLPLRISHLAKSYPGGVHAVQDVSMQVLPGQVLGLLGPNGAGKTTTLRMVMGLIHPTGGEIEVFGEPIHPGTPVLSRIGSFVEGSGFLPHLSGRRNLELYWQATGRPLDDAHLEQVLAIADLGKAVQRKVKTYSQGMRQRLAIAQAMLGLPDLLILDEPTNGLDPPQIHAMREVLRRYAGTGRTVVVSSHLLAEVEQTCTDVVVINNGRTIAAGSVAEMIQSSGEMSFTVDQPERAAAVLRGIDGVADVEVLAAEPGTARAEGTVDAEKPDTDGTTGTVDAENPDNGGTVDAENPDTAGTVDAENPDTASPVDPADTADGTVQADLGRVPAATAVEALVRAGIAVSAAAPRNRLEDVFLDLVGRTDADAKTGSSPTSTPVAPTDRPDHPGTATDSEGTR